MIAVDIDLGHPHVNERKEPVPGPVKSDIVIDLALLVAAGAAVTRGAGIAPETEAENAVPKKDHQKKDLPEIKNEPEIITEHHVTKKVALEKNHQEIETAKKGSVLMKVQMVDQKTGGAQRSVKQEKYNWLYIHLIL